MRRRDANYGRRGALQGVGGALLGLLLAAWALSGCGFKIPRCVVDGSCLPRPEVTAAPTATATDTIVPSPAPASSPSPTSALCPPPGQLFCFDSRCSCLIPTPTTAPTPPARPCPCLNRIGVGPLGGALKPHRGHGGLQCWTIDTTPKFGNKPCNPKTGFCGLPDNRDHPNFGGHCEFPGAPSWVASGETWISPVDSCEGLSSDGLPNQCYSREVCGKPGQKFVISAYPPLPLTDLYGAELVSPCAGGDGHGSYTGSF